MRWIILALALGVAALAAVVVGRTMMVPVYEPTTASAPPSKFDAEKIAAHLSEAVKLRTISWQDGAAEADVAASREALAQFRDWIAATYPAFAKTATREIVADYSLLFTWKGSDPSLKPVLLMSHLDVVPVVAGTEGNWKHPPFAGEIADGYVWGRGTLDVKQGVIGMLEAAEMLIASGRQPKRTIMFAFGHDEELGGHEGNEKVAALLASRGTKFEFVLDEGGAIALGVIPGVEPPVALVGVAEKGYVTLELTAHATGGHSSLPPPVNETAIGRLARAIERVGERPFEGRIDGVMRETLARVTPAMPFARRMALANLWLFEPIVVSAMSGAPAGAASMRTTVAPTVIAGGVKDNVLPPEAKASINFRVHPRDSVQSVVNHVKAAIGDAQVDVVAKPGAREPSPISDMNGPQFALIKRTLETVKPGVIVAPNLMSGGTDARYYFPMTTSVFRIVPAIVTEEDLTGAHGTNERVSIESLGLIADFYATLMVSADAELQAPPPR